VPSHFSAIGFEIASSAEILQYAKSLPAGTPVISTAVGDYVRWVAGGGAELWFERSPEGSLVGMNPHFDTQVRTRARLASRQPDPKYPLDGAFHVWLDPQPIGAHARRLFASTEADARAVSRALADAGALELADRYAEELSGGERQRLLVAMALAQEPDLLLLDEPTLHLDLAHQVALLAAIRHLRDQRGLTVLAVLHDLNLAAAFAPRVAVLDEGRIVADGPPVEVLTPDLVQRVFGVAVDEARTADGRRHLALHEF